MLNTKDAKPEDKKEKLKKLREFHQHALDKLGVPNALFIPKMAYKPTGKTERFISFFPSEVSKGEDIYVEFTSRDLDPEDIERRLYKWRFNPNYEEEYEPTPPNPETGHIRYLVPVAELIVITEEMLVPEAKEEIKFDDIPDPNSDAPMDQMTIRDYAAIHMRKPVSRKQWLNDLITK